MPLFLKQVSALKKILHGVCLTINDFEKGKTETRNAPSIRTHAGPLLFLTGIFFLNFTTRIILAPLMPTIEQDLGIGHAEAGSLFLLSSAGYFISLLGSGFLSSRLTHKRTIIFSAVSVGITLIGVSLCRSLWSIRLGLFTLGLAAGPYLPSGIATLTALVHSKDWGKGLAIHEFAPNIGFVAAPLMSEALLTWFSWRGVLSLLGLTSLISGIVFGRFAKGGEFHGEAPGFSSFRVFLAMPAFWIMAVLFSLGISGSLGVYTMLPLYLVTERGMDRDWANTLVALSRVSGLAVAFLAGWTADRFGSKTTMGTLFLLTGLTTILLSLVPGYWIVVIIFIQPMLAVGFFPSGFAALSAVSPQSSRNVVVSLTIPVAFLVGGGAVPTMIGVMGDAGSFAGGIAITGGLILTGFVLSFYLKIPDGKNPDIHFTGKDNRLEK